MHQLLQVSHIIGTVRQKSNFLVLLQSLFFQHFHESAPRHADKQFQRALNRGAAYHQLRRAISDVNGDRFRGNSDEEIQLWKATAGTGYSNKCRFWTENPSWARCANQTTKRRSRARVSTRLKWRFNTGI
jgi:hypothetical protein